MGGNIPSDIILGKIEKWIYFNFNPEFTVDSGFLFLPYQGPDLTLPLFLPKRD